MSEVRPISKKPQIDVCIATYKRPEMLKRLLESLITLQTGGRFSFGIIVVDNDRHRSAEPIVKMMKNKFPDIIYDVEPEKNVSAARNRSLSRANGDFIATIDDDEYATSQWLSHLYDTLTRCKADIVFGPIVPYFSKTTKEFIRQSTTFTRPNLPEGTMEDIIYNTGNSLFKKKLIEDMVSPFNLDFGGTLAEDTEFFLRLKKRGAKIVWSRKATVYEYIPIEKARISAILQRELRIGNLYFRVHEDGYIDISQPKVILLFKLCLHLIRLSLVTTLLLIRGLIAPKTLVKAIDSLGSLAFNLGVVAFLLNIRSDNYR